MRDGQPHLTVVHGLPTCGIGTLRCQFSSMSQEGHVILEGRAWLALPSLFLCLNTNHLSSLLLGSIETLATWRLAVQAIPRQPSYAWLTLAPTARTQDTPFPGLGFSHFEEGGWLQPGTRKLPSHSHPGSLGAV